MLLKLSEDKKVPTRVQLMRAGSFNYDGEPMLITAAILSSFKKNFDEKVRGYEDGKLPIDYFHENEKIAAGWISQLYLEADNNELWADVQWTPRAEKMLADGEIRYLSVEFHFDYEHNEGGQKFGPTLFGAGLTNRPFIKGMKPVKKLSEGERKMTLEQALAKIAELEKELAALKSSKEAADKELGDAKAKADGLEKDKALAEKKGKFDAMLAEGKAVEAQRESYMAGDMAKFAELAKPLNTTETGNGGGKKTSEGKDAQEQILELAETIVKEKKISLREAISQVLKSNKTLAEQYAKDVAVG